MDKCQKCGHPEGDCESMGQWEHIGCLERQLAAANAKLQERGEAFERAREAQIVLDRNKSSDPDMRGVEYMAAITAEIDARRVVRAYFATGEKEGRDGEQRKRISSAR